MPDQSAMHYYFNWSRERIDEMDAALTSFERQYDRMQSDIRSQAEATLTRMRATRDAFRETMTRQAKAGESDWVRAKTDLESQWENFATLADKYVDALGKHAEQYQATFRACAEAQVKAWRDSAERLSEAARAYAADQRAAFDSMASQMKADASAAQAKFAQLGTGPTEPWSALTAALAETRAAFDRANRSAQEAFERATRH